jgi:gliding motility-associated lipoprotein GldD
MTNRIKNLSAGRLRLAIMLAVFISASCKTNYTPKRSGYFRIDFPKERIFEQYNNPACPFSFEYANFGEIEYDSNDLEEQHEHPCWFNIAFKDYNAKIYLSYSEISKQNTLDKLIKDSYKLTFKHTVRADYIDETPVRGNHPHVSGIVYDVGGNAASGVQFYLTDSTRHFLRGSLYFNVTPNIDSLAPAIEYFRQDVVHIVNTLSWK